MKFFIPLFLIGLLGQVRLAPASSPRRAETEIDPFHAVTNCSWGEMRCMCNSRKRLESREIGKEVRKGQKPQCRPAKSRGCPAPAVQGLRQPGSAVPCRDGQGPPPSRRSLAMTKHRPRFAKRQHSPSRFRAPPCSRLHGEVSNAARDRVLSSLGCLCCSVHPHRPLALRVCLVRIPDASTAGWCDFSRQICMRRKIFDGQPAPTG